MRGLSSQALLRNAGTIFVGSGFSKALLLGAEIYCAYALGAEGYGRFSIAFAAVLVLATLSQTGLQFAVVRQLAIFQEQGEDGQVAACIRTSLAFVLIVAGILGGVLFLGSNKISSAVFGDEALAPLLQVAAVLLVFEALNQVISAIFRGLRQFRNHLITFDLARNAAFFLCVPLSFTRAISPIDIFLLMLAGSAAGTLFGLFRLNLSKLIKGVRREDLFNFQTVLHSSSPLLLWQVMQMVSDRLLLVIGGMFLMASEVGVLALGVRFANILDFPQTVVNSTTLVEFSRLHHRGDLEAINRLYRLVTAALLAFCALLSLPMLLGGSDLMRWMGEGYDGYVWVMVTLVLAKLVDVGTGPAGKVIMASGRLRALLGLALFGAGLQLLGVVPLIMLWALPGAVLGTAIRTIIFVGARHWFLIRHLGVNTFDRLFLWMLLIVLGATLLGAATAAALIDEYGTLSGAIIGIAVITVGGWWVLAQHSSMIQKLPATLFWRLFGR